MGCGVVCGLSCGTQGRRSGSTVSTTPGIKLVCQHDGCERRSVARRLCHAHYQQAWKAGELENHEKLPPRQRKHDYVCPAGHKHETSATCFIQHQCRCDPCCAAHSLRERTRHKLKAYGRWDSGLVDVAPVRKHVLMLMDFGIGYKRIAQLAGYRSSTPVRTIVWGRQDPGPRFGEMQKRVKRETAERILAIEPSIENLGARRAVPALGTHRRIQALAARGWSLSKIGARLGMDISNLTSMMHRERVGAATHLRMVEIYEELWDQEPPHDEWRSKGAYTRAVNFAARRGWLPPLAWDDIDTDPEPERDVVTQGRATADEVLDDVEFLLEGGEAPLQVAAIVGRKVGTLAKLAKRNGRRELANIFNAIDKRVAA